MINEIQKKINENEQLKPSMQVKVDEERTKKQEQMVESIQLHSEYQSKLNEIIEERKSIEKDIHCHKELLSEFMSDFNLTPLEVVEEEENETSSSVEVGGIILVLLF